MGLIIFVIVLILLLGGGGYYGRGAGWPGYYSTGGIGIGGILLILLIFMLLTGWRY